MYKIGDVVKEKSTGLLFIIRFVNEHYIGLERYTIHNWKSNLNFDLFFEKVEKKVKRPISRLGDYDVSYTNEWINLTKNIKAKPLTVSYEIDKIVHNKRKHATTVFFKDGDIIVVKRSKDTPHDIYNAVASAIAKKVYGNNTQFKKVLEKVEYI